MYSTCLYCNRPLGSNETLELFPVGRRVAFDEARGRLWVVCSLCRRWNLSPLEQRWEVVEACERLFRATPRRVSTEDIALARVGDGLELVRIGKPLRPEFAAWRYGDQLRRRRTLHRMVQGANSTYAAALWATGAALLTLPWAAYDLMTRQRVVARAETAAGTGISVLRKHVPRLRLLPEGAGGWTARVRHRDGVADLHGDAALKLMGKLLPHVNLEGAAANQVQEAVHQLELAGETQALFAQTAAHLRKWQYHGFIRPDHKVRTAPIELRLALEMAAHEDAERRALEGELAELERAWREAEEIASIADSLLVPRAITDRIARWRGGDWRTSRDGGPASP